MTLIKSFFIVVGGFILTACEPSSKATNSLPAELKIKEVSRSENRAGGEIKVSHLLPEMPQEGRLLDIILTIRVDSNSNVQVKFADNDELFLYNDQETILAGTDSGVLELLVRLKPLMAGKTYLKMIVSTQDGNKARAYAIALPVADITGIVPKKQRASKSRIDLPSSIQ